MPRGGHAMNKMLLQLGMNAKEAENTIRTITTDQKNQVLAAVADHLFESTESRVWQRDSDSLWRLKIRSEKSPA